MRTWSLVAASILLGFLSAIVQDVMEGMRTVTVLLAGQSNMAGRGDLALLAEDELQPDEHIQAFVEGRWTPAREPMHATVDTTKPGGVGPGLFLARRLRELDVARRVRLVPTAIGGTAIAQWMPGTPLYDGLVAAVRASGEKPAYMVWFQGESDALNDADARAYSERYAAFEEQLRTDLGVGDAMTVVLVLVQSMRAGIDHVETVREQQRAVAANARVPMLVVDVGADPSAIDWQDAGLHLTTGASRQFGRQLGDVIGAHEIGADSPVASSPR